MKKFLILVLPAIIGGLFFACAHLLPGQIDDNLRATFLFYTAVLITVIHNIYLLWYFWVKKWWIKISNTQESNGGYVVLQSKNSEWKRAYHFPTEQELEYPNRTTYNANRWILIYRFPTRFALKYGRLSYFIWGANYREYVCIFILGFSFHYNKTWEGKFSRPKTD